MTSTPGPVLVLISASFVASNKFEFVDDSFSSNDSIKILNTTKILLDEKQRQTVPIPDASQFCDGTVAAYLLQSETEIDFESIQKTAKLSSSDIFKTKDKYFITKLKQILFPQKPALEQTLIICNPPLSQQYVDEMNEELKLKGIFILYQEEISSDNNSILNDVLNDEEKEQSVNCTITLCESFACVDQMTLNIGCEHSELLETYAPDSWNSRWKEMKYKFTQISDSAKIENISVKLTAQRTLALIKPTAVEKGCAEDIIKEIKKNGFTIIAQKRVLLKLEQAQYFYKEHEGKPFFPNLTAFMSSGPICALVLERVEAIKCWRTLLGPTNTFTAREKAPQSLRGRYGSDQTANACHGSDSVESAQREIKFYFPEMSMSPNEINVAQPTNVVEEYMLQKLENNETLKEFLVRGLSELAKEKPGSKLVVVEWFARWLLNNNPNKPVIEEISDTNIDELDFVSKCKHFNGGNDLKVIFISGGPGSGKGTQCKRIVDKYGFTQISTGDLCRKVMNDKTSPHASDIKDIMENGKLIHTELLLELIKDEMVALKGYKYLLDGFPRSLDQCIMFEKDLVGCVCTLNFVCDDDVLMERCLKRAKTSNRVDDNEETIQKRLETFHNETNPTVEYLKSMNKVKYIDATGDVDKVWEKVQVIMDPICKQN